MDLAVVVNPTAGRGRGARVHERVVARFEAAGATVRAVQGTDAADAERRCREAVARRPDALVAIGGDGMVHIAVQAAAQSGVPLGIVPAGTGNDLATCLALPVKDPATAADIVLAGKTRRIDAVRVGERWFGCVLGAGFDAAVNAKANAMSWPHGTAKYVLATLSTLRTFKPIAYTLTIDGEEWRTSAMMVAVGNARSYGGGMRIVPDASLDDGLLDVCVLEALSVPAFLRAFPKVFSGTHGTHRKVTLRTAKTITIDAPGVTAYADGERFGTLPLTCEIVPEALTVFTAG
jgi:diacylglycerol kinase (ATP)